MKWDLAALKQAVGKIHGDAQKKRIEPCLNSIVERQEYARFHYHESKRELEPFTAPRSDIFRLVTLVLSVDDDEREEFEWCKFKAQAHIVSCCQSLHSVSDILAHVIYYALNLQVARSESDISMANVVRWSARNPEFSTLCQLLRQLTEHPGYRYLGDIVNHSKHRSVVEPYFNLNLQKPAEQMAELKFKEFTFKGRAHEATLVYEFLTPEYDRQGKLVVEIGNQLNALVGAAP